jgi:SAM-dependent methyltransferase
MTTQLSVQQHYGVSALNDSITQALEQAGLDAGRLNEAQLAPLDQFHVRGLAATQDMAGALSLTAGAAVLDVGCGLGGPARCLAAAYDCRVTGLDLSDPFIRAARLLTERAGLADRVTFVPGDALEMPFPDESFDCVWTQHTAMNIADRARLYAGIYRVLRPSGTLAIYDVVEGSGEPLIFPVPWARTLEISFLLTPEAMRQALTEAGFTVAAWTDTTEAALAWFSAQQGMPPPANPLSLGVVMGSEFREMAANLARNLEEGRARLVQAILRRA